MSGSRRGRSGEDVREQGSEDRDDRQRGEATLARFGPAVGRRDGRGEIPADDERHDDQERHAAAGIAGGQRVNLNDREPGSETPAAVAKAAPSADARAGLAAGATISFAAVESATRAPSILRSSIAALASDSFA